MQNSITIVGLDSAKNSIAVATAETGGKQELRYYGKIGGDMASSGDPIGSGLAA